jgi:hypothetical protein
MRKLALLIKEHLIPLNTSAQCSRREDSQDSSGEGASSGTVVRVLHLGESLQVLEEYFFSIRTRKTPWGLFHGEKLDASYLGVCSSRVFVKKESTHQVTKLDARSEKGNSGRL